MTAKFYYILTNRGTLVCYDTVYRYLSHRPMTEHSEKHVPVVLFDPNDVSFALIGRTSDSEFDPVDILEGQQVQSVSGCLPGCLSFKINEKYATVEPNLCIGLRMSELEEAASFFPITSEQLHALQTLVANDWIIPSSRLLVSRKRIAVGKDFILYIGDLMINLLEASFSYDKRTPDYMDLIVSGSPHLRIERAKHSGQEITRKTIWIQPAGNMGNRALQYLAAEGIRMNLSNAEIQNLTLPEWNIVSPRSSSPQSSSSCTVYNRWIDVKGLADCLERDVIDSLILAGFPFNLSHYPPRATAKKLLFSTKGGAEAKGFEKNELVCSVRADEILTGFHRDYIVLPVKYYQLLSEHTGLDLVFFGQLGGDPYSKSLREAFPNARFVASRGPEYDFDTLRKSVNIAPSVSTFAWLAAWLSDAEKVFMPIAGMFNPIQHPQQMFLPYDDETYEFILFPFAKAVNVFMEADRFAAQQEQLSRAQFISRDEVREIHQRAKYLWPQRPYVGGFDPKYYLECTPEAVEAVCAGKISALQHYYSVDARHMEHSTDYYNKYNIMPFDRDFYLHTYPEVAMDIARGYYGDALDHYASVGIGKCYLTKRYTQNTENT